MEAKNIKRLKARLKYLEMKSFSEKLTDSEEFERKNLEEKLLSYVKGKDANKIGYFKWFSVLLGLWGWGKIYKGLR